MLLETRILSVRLRACDACSLSSICVRLCMCVCVYACEYFCDWRAAVQWKMRPLLCVCNKRSQPLLINLLGDKPVLSPCLNSLCEVSPTDTWLANHPNRPSLLPLSHSIFLFLHSARLPELNFNFNHRPANLHKSSTWATLNYGTSILGRRAAVAR